MSLAEYEERLGPELFRAIERKGFAELTAVQLAVLDPKLAGRDLRITSQTGSGKTLAIGLTLRALTGESTPASSGVAAPRALVVAPTRELAHQVEQELSWLYAESGMRIATATGGASYRDEHRALAKGPALVVGTPGRLLDHLARGAIDPSQVQTVVLDEADRMLDLGFREDLERLFEFVPAERTTHLVSATFPRMVRSLADRLQREPAHVEGTRLGAANADIQHVIHVVDPAQRLDALINLLLANPDDQTLVFVRTRADAAHIANELVVTGFAASALSGEMEQAARNRALAAFRDGRLRVLIATDVAARGIDVQGVTRVVHGELPTNPDAYTHRSGRTGRAGRKGTSAMLVAPIGVVRATRLLRELGVPHRVEPIPSAEQITNADDQRIFHDLTSEPPQPSAAEGEAASGEDEPREDTDPSARWGALAQRLIEAGNVEQTLMRLLMRATRGLAEPRTVRAFPERKRDDPRVSTTTSKDRRTQKREHLREGASGKHASRSTQHEPRAARPNAREGAAEPADARHDRAPHPRAPRASAREEVSDAVAGRSPRSRSEPRAPRTNAGEASTEYTSFHVSWGQREGADARRLLALLCRRGEIRGRDVGAIRVEPSYSLVQVANAVAASFARAASRPDPREPHIVIRPDRAQTAEGLAATKAKLSTHRFERGKKAGPGGRQPPKRHKPAPR